MIITAGVVGFLLIFVCTFYLQIPSFFIHLGYGWSHRYEIKRWGLRLGSLFSFVIFLILLPSLSEIIYLGIPYFIFFISSFLNTPSRVLIALSEHQIVKQLRLRYPKDAEVIGYTFMGKSIAYPINEILIPRHLINDVFEGQPLCISYCAACRSTLIYHAMVNGQRLIFEVVGVYRRNMIIRDKQTGTIWQQSTGMAMYGELKGATLEAFPYQIMVIGDWLQSFPNSWIAEEDHRVRIGFLPKKFLFQLLTSVTNQLLTPGFTPLDGLPLREKIWGIEFNGISKAYPYSELAKCKSFTDHFNGFDIKIEYHPQTNQISAINLDTQRPIVFQSHWWLGWKEFHPDTIIWRADDKRE